MPAVYTLTMIFDENVESVVNPGFPDDAWTTSGTAKNTMSSQLGDFKVILKSGYIIDNVVANNVTLVSFTDTTFNLKTITANAIVTITSKRGGGSMSKSVDLTTLTGWANLSDGEHTITIKAKADGYRDSEASEGVSVTKGSTGETWVLTDGILTNALSMSNGDSREFSIDFVSNSQQFDKFRIEGHGISIDEEYDIGGAEQYVFFVAGTYSRQVGNITMSEEYRTITFETSPTGDLLTWLQANGTKQ